MDSPLHTLRLAFLVTLFVILIYILYKRLLKSMGKDDSKPVYASVEDLSYSVPARQLVIKIDNPSRDALTINVTDKAQSLRHSVVHIAADSQEEILLDVDLESGRYLVEMISDNHRTSRFFVV